VIFSFLLVSGCATTKVAPDAVDLTVDFSWEGIKRCSNHSPEINVSGIPPTTKSFKVELKDLDVPTWDHGGGAVTNDGSGLIPPGSLKSGYNGPCPPSGSHSYQFTVKAVNEAGIIIGIGKATKKFP
jgi:phosphatidylethanolamine-binding protein (PEBP) family uncharacterized protein